MINLETLKELLDYNSETGTFTWLVNRSNHIRIGDVAGTKRPGAIQIKVQGKSYEAHRLAWLYVHGTWPTNVIDHINGDPYDNRISNLREASVSQNQCNSKTRIDSTTGLKGVGRHGKSWRSRIHLKGKAHVLGTFDCPAAAHFAYQVAADKMHGPYARVF